MIEKLSEKIAAKVGEALSAPRECVACRNWAAHVAYMEKQVEHERSERKSERDEYKRTVDRLLEAAKVGPVGQGVTGGGPPVMLDPAKLVSMFDEIEEQKTGA